MAKQYKREFLEQVAEEMNKVMALTPAMEVSMPDDDTLLDTIKYNATGGGHVDDAIRAKDKFSDKVWEFFEDIGVWDGKKNAVIIPDAKAAKKAVKEIKQEELELVEDVPAPKKAKGKTDKKPAPVEEPEEEIVEDEKDEGEMSTKKTATKKAATKKSKPVEKTTVKKTAATKPMAVPSKKSPVEKKKAATKSVKATKSPKAEKKDAANLDEYGFREGSKKSSVMSAIKTGKMNISDLVKKFGNQARVAIAQSKTRTNTKIVTTKDGRVKLA